ncbi:MAG: hypothetical protein H7Z14_10895, partial [Anaerolineae bacterium]|nr:hypothetical protein [Phycisphaerae bacterium]
MCSRQPPIQFEALEHRRLLAVHTVDFNNYAVQFSYFDFLLRDSHTPTSGFSYTLGTGNGQRPNINGITWADASYYDTVLGAGGFSSVNSWNMKPLVVYSNVKNGDWINQGWNPYQDMAEGSACIDDAGRAAVTFADDYLLNGTEASYQKARDILTFVAYMTTRQGKTYNFAWLDAPAVFGWDPIQAQDAHYMYRSEYVKRTQYPSASPSSAWFDTNSDTSHIINWPSPVAAPPFMPHAKYSVYIDDLQDANNADVAKIYDGPLYTTAGGGPTSFKTGIKKSYTNSTQRFGFDEARALQGFARGMQMMQKRAHETGGLSGDDLVFAKFLENNTNRLIRYVQTRSMNTLDSKIGSAVLVGLVDYYRVMYGTSEYGAYVSPLPTNSNTAETSDDRPVQTTVMSMIDTLATTMKSKQFRSADWRNGIFIDDANGGNWDAWGQLGIYALARTYSMKINIGANPADASVASLLDYAAYAADSFYGVEAYHYAVPGANNVRTKERITGISGWSALYHTNSAQIAYHNSSIVLGLEELARAYLVSDRADKVTRAATYLEGMKSVASWFVGNNTSLLDYYDGTAPMAGTNRGRGVTFDGLSPGASSNRNGGGESQAEGLWAIIHAKAAIAAFNLSSTFSYEQGTTAAARPTVTASRFAFDAPKPALTFTFSQSVGASVDPSDIVVTNLDTNTVIPTSALSLSYNTPSRILTVTFPGITNGILPNGQYTAVVSATGIVGNSANPMAANHVLAFRVLAGDADGNGVIDFDDYSKIDNGFNNNWTGFGNGDFDYNGIVDFDDYSIIDQAFNTQSRPARSNPSPA